MKRMINVMKAIVIGFVLVCITGCTTEAIDDRDSSEVGRRTEDLNNLTVDNLLYVSIVSNDDVDWDKNIEIQIYLDKGILCGGTREEFQDEDDATPAEIILTEEQCQELKKRIVEYSYVVKGQEKDYWPQTDEYPEMMVLFGYEIWFGDDEYYEKYRQSGALCYPDGWGEFVDELMEYGRE